MTAEALGLWGNTRRAFFLGLFYVSVLVVYFFIRVDLDSVISYLAQFFANYGFVVVIMIVFNRQLIERQKAEDLAETLESANAKLAAYAARNESLTLQSERERMARELHDTLAQGVAGLILQLEAIKAYQRQESYPQAETVLEQALNRARNTLSESRAAIEDLRNEAIDFETAVSQSIAQFNATGTTNYELTINLTAVPLPQHIQHHARRVLYEALTNVQKHAQANTARVSIIQSEAALTLTAQDDGIGFDPQQAPTRGHFGLRGFQERAQLTGSGYTLSSSPQEGTTIEFVFPLAENGENR
ncbi:MAG: sensor histidine kinase [Chloroflexi bacterium]|nr:sensor histidine kinase [Chloroflexota bacterium]